MLTFEGVKNRVIRVTSFATIVQFHIAYLPAEFGNFERLWEGYVIPVSLTG